MQNIIFYFLLDCECLAPSFTGPPCPKHTPPAHPHPAQVYCTRPHREELERAAAEGPRAPGRPAEHLAPLSREAEACPDNLKGKKSQTSVLSFGGIIV